MAKRVLLVDDEEETRLVFETALKQAGYEVTIAGTGQEALAATQQQQFDLILLDQMMPDMSGNETLRSIKANQATAETPVAMLTNFGHDEMVKEALNSGANDYILKYKVSPDDLAVKVRGLIGE